MAVDFVCCAAFIAIGAGGAAGLQGRGRCLLCGGFHNHGKRGDYVSEAPVYRRHYRSGYSSRTCALSHLDCFSCKGERSAGCQRGSCGGAAAFDSHDLWHFLSVGQKAVCKAGKISSIVFDFYGAACDFRGLFLLYGGKLYDCQKQAGESRTGEHRAAHAVFIIADASGAAAGKSKIWRGELDFAVLCDSGGMFVQHDGGVFALYASGGDRTVRGGQL